MIKLFGHNAFPLCSECFLDEGLRLDARSLGTLSKLKCKNCSSTSGSKLSINLIEKLSYRYFVQGTFIKTNYGGAPYIQMNKLQESTITGSNLLMHDIKLIGKVTGLGFFHYGPNLWMVGQIEMLDMLRSESTRGAVIDSILKQYPHKFITPDTRLYRIRKNPESLELSQFDSPPNPSNGRLDRTGHPVLYCSEDLTVCIHECRSTVEDEIYVATLTANQSLKLLDLSEMIPDKDLDLAIYMLFYAKGHSYQISQDISIAAKLGGFDGLIYPSYFSSIRTDSLPVESYGGLPMRILDPLKDYTKSTIIPNVAIFGRPIQDGTVVVHCLNKVILKSAAYGIQFGPVLTETKKE